MVVRETLRIVRMSKVCSETNQPRGCRLLLSSAVMAATAPVREQSSCCGGHNGIQKRRWSELNVLVLPSHPSVERLLSTSDRAGPIAEFGHVKSTWVIVPSRLFECTAGLLQLRVGVEPEAGSAETVILSRAFEVPG